MVRRLAAAGTPVVALARNLESAAAQELAALTNVELRKGDVCDLEALKIAATGGVNIIHGNLCLVRLALFDSELPFLLVSRVDRSMVTSNSEVRTCRMQKYGPCARHAAATLPEDIRPLE